MKARKIILLTSVIALMVSCSNNYLTDVENEQFNASTTKSGSKTYRLLTTPPAFYSSNSLGEKIQNDVQLVFSEPLPTDFNFSFSVRDENNSRVDLITIESVNIPAGTEVYTINFSDYQTFYPIIAHATENARGYKFIALLEKEYYVDVQLISPYSSIGYEFDYTRVGYKVPIVVNFVCTHSSGNGGGGGTGPGGHSEDGFVL